MHAASRQSVGGDAAPKRAPSFDSELHEFHRLECGEVEVGDEDGFAETAQQLSVDVPVVERVDVVAEVQQFETFADLKHGIAITRGYTCRYRVHQTCLACT